MGGCGGGAEDAPPQRVLDPALVRLLPATQYVLGGQLCPRPGDRRDAIAVDVIRRQAERQRAALERALVAAPSAAVGTVRPDVDGTGVRRERLTVRGLAETHLAGLQPVEGVRDDGCSARERERLRRALR